MSVGRSAAIGLGAAAVVLSLLLLQERFTYTGPKCNSTLAQDCVAEEEGVVCRPPLWSTEQSENDDRSQYAERKCSRGRAWRWATFGLLGVAGATAVLGATLFVPLARRTRRPPPMGCRAPR